MKCFDGPALAPAVVEKLKVLETDDRAYAITDVMPQGSWSLMLFKRLEMLGDPGTQFTVSQF